MPSSVPGSVVTIVPTSVPANQPLQCRRKVAKEADTLSSDAQYSLRCVLPVLYYIRSSDHHGECEHIFRLVLNIYWFTATVKACLLLVSSTIYWPFFIFFVTCWLRKMFAQTNLYVLQKYEEPWIDYWPLFQDLPVEKKCIGSWSFTSDFHPWVPCFSPPADSSSQQGSSPGGK